MEELRFQASATAGEVSGLLMKPADARAMLCFAHGAGAGMRHLFMHAMSERLAARGVATLRWQFPYMEKGSKRPDPQPLLLAAVRSAVATAREHAHGLPLFAGGKSMGGRMTSLAAAQSSLDGVRGIVFFGFPLHAANRPSDDRAAHLFESDVPLLFLQGTRDALADLTLLRPIVERLGAGATLRVFEDADHSFKVPKRTGLTDAEMLDRLAADAADWILSRSSRQAR